MNFFRRKKLKVCRPEFLLEELEPRIVFDATLDSLFTTDPWHDTSHYPQTLPDASAYQAPLGTLLLSDLLAVSQPVSKDLKVVLISDSLADNDGVREAINKDAHVVVVDSHHDNLKTLNHKLGELVNSQGKKIGSLAVLAHAEKGTVILGTDRIDLANVQQFQPQLEETGRIFAEKGQIQLFGCSVAGDVYGQGLVEVISVATHTDVFASTNPTGHGPEKDWTLEYSTNPGKEMYKVVDTEQMAALPVDLALGDVVITNGTIGPVVEGTTAVNLNSAFSVSNKEVGQVTNVTVLANPSSTAGWDSIAVSNDATFLASVGFPPGTIDTAVPNEIKIRGATAGQATAVLGTLQGVLETNFHGNAQILIYAQDPDGDWAANTLDVTVNPVPTQVHVPLATQTVNENATASIPGIYVSTPDVNSTGQLTVTLSVSHGTLTVQAPATTPGSTPTTYTSTSLTFTDTLANVNTALGGLKYTPTTGYTGPDQLNITAVDQSTPSPGSGSATVAITVAPITYSAPVLTVPGAQSLSENSSLAITGISVTDADIGATGKLTVTLSVSHGTLTVQVPATSPGTTPTTYTNANITFTDTLANVNTALAGLIYTPTAKYDSTDTLTVTAVDQSPDPLADSATVAITVTNVAPTISPHASVTAVAGSPTAITGITIADPDIGSTNISVTLSVSHGVLNVPTSFTVTGNGTGTLTINDTLANVNTLISGLQYTATLTYTGPDTLTLNANDQSTPTPGAGNREVAITVNALAYAPPVLTVPGAQSLSENSSFAITGISVTDADIGATGKLAVTLSVSHGTLTVQVPATSPGTTPTTYTNANITFTDTLANVNTALAGLIYTPTAKYDSTDTLTVTAVDQSPDPLADSATVAITVTNVAPAITAPATATAVTATATAITGIALADPDIASTNISVTLSVYFGVLNVPSSTNVTGNGTSTLTINDTLANVNTQIAGLRYTSNTGYKGLDILSINASDLSTPTAGTDSEQVQITVNSAPTPAASPPAINAPSVLSVNEDTAVAIQFGPSNPISVQYADTTTELRVTLQANNGYVTLGWKGHLNSYTGDGTIKVNFAGPLAAINEALYGLKYTPVHDYFDTTDDTLTIRVDDQAGQVTTKTMAINVYSVNDPPVITVPGTQSVSLNTPKVISGVSVADPDVGAGSLKMTLGALHGSLSVTGLGPSADITFTDNLTNVNTLLGTLTYRPVSGYWGPDWITITANDQGNSGAGGAMSDTEKVSLRVGNY